MSTRIRRCSTEKEFEQVIDEFIMLGYEMQTRGNDNALLVKKKKKEHGWGVVNSESTLDSFIMGFRLGAKFTYDTFIGTDTPFENLLKE